TTVNLDDVGAVVAGASRLRRTAQSLESLATMAEGGPPLERCGRNLDGELNAFQSWYRSLGYALVNDRTVPPPHLRDGDGRRQLLACVRDAARGRDEQTVKSALLLLWASQHLDNLWHLEGHLRQAQTS